MKGMKFLGLIAICLLTQLAPDVTGISTEAAIAAGEVATQAEMSREEELVSETGAAVESGQVSSETGATETAVPLTVEIPDVAGMREEDAVSALEAVVLPDGAQVEIIKSYEYSTEAEADTVFAQEPVGSVDAKEAAQVFLSVSLGQEPAEQLAGASQESGVSQETGASQLAGGSQEAGALSSFGLAAAADMTVNSTESRLGIDWEGLPYSYEYNWDNSANCWYHGVWVDGVCYKTPEGTYSTDVRHKMQLYCDGTYVYLHVVISRDYGAKFNGEDYQFWIDGQMAAFQLEYMGGGTITGNTSDLAPGTYQVEVRHRDASMSYEVVPDSLAYFTKYDNDVNAEAELRIPLSELQRQNPNINLDSIGTIEFYTPNLMYRRIMASGADTFPLATAGAAFLLIPASTVLLKKKKWKKEGKGSK